MKKAAFFVEGQTELIFVRRLLEEIAGAHRIAFHEERRLGNNYLTLSSDVIADQSYFVLIVDCCSDGAVASAIIDRHASLGRAGYELILGLRDLYPLSLAELGLLRAGLASVLPTTAPTTHITVAVAEVEAWFMQENTHFLRIDRACTRAAIQAATGYDIDLDLAENLLHPARTLDQAYRVGSKRYSKKKKSVSRTVRALDYGHLYLDRRAMLGSFDEFATQM
ncbi:MAG: hypothetical protein WB523_20640, partial [Candidatus Sulfotelmatobacter sp.]